jgi:alpha-glucosidase
MNGPSSGATRVDDDDWWRRGVLYQVYPRSFADSDGDGNGDLRGVIAHLDHLEWLGVDGIWLSPVTCSPNADWGYDVSDYCAVQPDLGTLADLDELVAEAGRRGIRIMLDLVPSHTSVSHPWFADARASRSSRHRDWYVWADAPNNWISSFGGPAWTLDEATGQYYLHNHLAEQPDLNWWNEEVRQAFDDILRFWFERGIAGFRIDVCNGMVKDAELRDNPPAEEGDTGDAALFGQRFVYNANRPEAHDVIRRWREVADEYGAVLVGETPVESMKALAAFYGNGRDQLHLAFNFPFINATLRAGDMRPVVADAVAALPAEAWPAWTGSNHDLSRLATRWAGGDPARVRAALLVLLGLPGTPVLYQGDEIGLPDVPVDRPDVRDPLGQRFWPYYRGRDPMRTPMHWTAAGGFTQEGVVPWLPMGDTVACNVADQQEDRSSVLWFTRDLLAARRRLEDLATGSYTELAAVGGAWAWRRGAGVIVAVNLSDEPAAVDGVGGGRVCVGTDRDREGAAVAGRVELAPWEGVIVELSASMAGGPGQART